MHAITLTTLPIGPVLIRLKDIEASAERKNYCKAIANRIETNKQLGVGSYLHLICNIPLLTQTMCSTTNILYQTRCQKYRTVRLITEQLAILNMLLII